MTLSIILLVVEIILTAVNLSLLVIVKKVVKEHSSSFTGIMQSLMKSIHIQNEDHKVHSVILREIHPAILRTESDLDKHDANCNDRHKGVSK